MLMARKTGKRSPTMTDVAKLAGVSQTTVSFVINNRQDIHIAEETKVRVWEAVEELGYRPNAMARSLRASKSNTIGLISDEIATTPFAVQIVLGAQETAWEQENVLLLVNTGGNQEMEEAAIESMLERQVDGIIYATMYHREAHPPASLYQVPCILVDCFVADRSLPSVVPDELGGGRVATAKLLEKGHRRIGLINNREDIPATSDRLEGYRKALADHDISFDRSLVVDNNPYQSGGYEGAQKLMQLSDPPTAIFCFNDRMAMGAYDALHKLNLSIPDDVAVMGFDNQEVISANLYPPLSTMQLPHYEMGRWAVNYLLEHEGKDLQPAQHTLTCPYIERQSI